MAPRLGRVVYTDINPDRPDQTGHERHWLLMSDPDRQQARLADEHTSIVYAPNHIASDLSHGTWFPYDGPADAFDELLDSFEVIEVEETGGTSPSPRHSWWKRPRIR